MKNSLAIAYSMKKKAKKMASGGSVQTGPTIGSIIGYPGADQTAPKKAAGGMISPEEPDDSDEDRQSDPFYGDGLVDRIIQKMSEGGRVANGSMTEGLAGEAPNEFDDLVLRDDLESSSDGANNGDFIGNEQEDADRSDMVSRIMKSRAKKDRLPNPR